MRVAKVNNSITCRTILAFSLITSIVTCYFLCSQLNAESLNALAPVALAATLCGSS